MEIFWRVETLVEGRYIGAIGSSEGVRIERCVFIKTLIVCDNGVRCNTAAAVMAER